MKILKRYTNDTIKRIKEFHDLKKDVYCEVIHGDSRTIDLIEELEKKDKNFAKLVKKNKISGIFTSPPYVGQIDYHEQHAYAYELFEIERNDEMEIGPQSNGKSMSAKEKYVKGICDVLVNVRDLLKDDADVFIVANDEYNLYPEIAEKSGYIIVEEFIRPVLHRTESDSSLYTEKIFRFRKKEE